LADLSFFGVWLPRADVLSDAGVRVAVFVLLPVDALVDGVVLPGVPVMVFLLPVADDPAGATAAGVPVMVLWLPIADERTAVLAAGAVEAFDLTDGAFTLGLPPTPVMVLWPPELPLGGALAVAPGGAMLAPVPVMVLWLPNDPPPEGTLNFTVLLLTVPVPRLLT
jgi:hypothetical protein